MLSFFSPPPWEVRGTYFEVLYVSTYVSERIFEATPRLSKKSEHQSITTSPRNTKLETPNA